MSFSITHIFGEMESGPPFDVFDDLLAELAKADAEHTDVSVKHETEWCLSAFPSGLLVWENVEGEGGPFHMKDVSGEKVLVSQWKAVTMIRKGLLGIAFTATTLFANGGPVFDPRSTPTGDIGPRQQTAVRLIGEDLKLSVRSDFESYHAHAKYRLTNPGKPLRMAYGMPFRRHYRAEKQKPSIFENSIRLQVGGTSVPVRIVETFTPKPYDDTERCRLIADGEGKPLMSMPDTPCPSFDSWMIADIDVPTGDSTIQLDFDARIWFSGWATSKWPFPGYEALTLIYDLAPAGYWAGPAEYLRIELDPGPYPLATITPSQPKGWTRSANAYVLEMRNVDLKTLGTARAKIDPTWKELRDVSAVNKQRDAVSLIVKASSEQPASGAYSYRAANMTDGDFTTPWCAKNPDKPWVEVTLSPKKKLEGHLWFIMIPGVAATEQLSTENPRIKKIGLTPCMSGKPETKKGVLSGITDGFRSLTGTESDDTIYTEVVDGKRSAVEIKSATPGSVSFGKDGTLIRKEGSFDLEWELRAGRTTCVRITVLETYPGTKYNDVCISEIVAVMR